MVDGCRGDAHTRYSSITAWSSSVMKSSPGCVVCGACEALALGLVGKECWDLEEARMRSAQGRRPVTTWRSSHAQTPKHTVRYCVCVSVSVCVCVCVCVCE